MQNAFSNGKLSISHVSAQDLEWLRAEGNIQQKVAFLKEFLAMTKQELCAYLAVTTQHLDSMSRSKQGLDRLNKVLNTLISEVGRAIDGGKSAHSFFSQDWVYSPNPLLDGAQPLTILVRALTSEQKMRLEEKRSACEAENNSKVISVEFGRQESVDTVNSSSDSSDCVEVSAKHFRYLTQLSIERGVSVEEVLEAVVLEHRQHEFRNSLKQLSLAQLLELYPEATARFIEALVETIN